ncbi:ABC transporter ATP-binding protein [Cyanobium sp. BA5m-21]|uniref:ABC transporter ATP-binding protein n=1 Tax=unclassified Cyanobium TaxID=2627006 RepID=UPI0020CE12CB|nr:MULTISPECIES: ABC transporter ATP-binding protein [unclassified Cyanobium]MCP9903226.1 ABC transporter ATP-binding protein [Cyanobium sp. BA5m-10]MCP9908031.1 ABC transporter ATP-binding protein [Cyanobium sp. BA5m-21]
MDDSDVVIRVEGLGKKYTIKHEQQLRHNTLRDAVAHQAAALGRWANPFTLAGQLSRARRHAPSNGEEDFWALKDVSFEIRRGERVGIIGRNGAGKSTLLKILSRITEPTTGRVEIRGRVASLLEVGTGFHPELTGRENIYLNGAILGMMRREIRSKFDEIVDFAEVEKFLDTPVKRYSSGMYVRLAFAVAAHLEPEILVVDEVLAVGDASFQKKCLGKMEDVADREGRTVLFVSHNMPAILSLCNKGLLLSQGENYFAGQATEAVNQYAMMSLSSASKSEPLAGKYANVEFSIRSIDDKEKDEFTTGEPIKFEIHVISPTKINKARIGIGINTIHGFRLTTLHTYFQFQPEFDISFTACATAILKSPILNAGSYIIELALYEQNQLLESWQEAGRFNIASINYYGTGKMPDPSHQGPVLSDAEWSIL